MINKGARFDSYAYRSAEHKIASALVTAGFEDGIFVSFDSNGSLVKADGKSKAFMLTTSKKTGRDLVTGKISAKGSILVGHFMVSTDQVASTDAFAPGKALYVNASGLLSLTGVTVTVGSGETATTIPPILVGYAMSALDADGILRAYILP